MLQRYQPEYPDGGLPAWQTSIIGLISGAVGPFTNAPIDTIKCVLLSLPSPPSPRSLAR